MGCGESTLWSCDINDTIITPTKIPYPYDDYYLLSELKKQGIIFGKIYNVIRGEKILCKLSDVTMPQNYGLLKINNDGGNTGYYIINNNFNPCYYIWTKKDNNWTSFDIQRVEGEVGKQQIKIKENGLYNGWWLPNNTIHTLQENEYATKINNYKQSLEEYKKYSECDSQIIEKEFLKITNEYNTLIYFVPVDKLLANSILQPPTKLKSAKEIMFSS